MPEQTEFAQAGHGRCSIAENALGTTRTGGVPRLLVGRISSRRATAGYHYIFFFNLGRRSHRETFQEAGDVTAKIVVRGVPATPCADRARIGRPHASYDGMREIKHVAYDSLNAGQTRQNPVY